MRTKKFAPYSKVRRSGYYQAAKSICEILQKSGFESYFVGGCVRDLILNPNILPKDIDISTSASFDEISKLFASTQFVGEAFGVCLVRYKGYSFEVATFRVDGTYTNKRHPDFIQKGTFFEDSCRRDFTINSIYYNPSKKILIDHHDGISDLQHKILRCVGLASARFQEDSLRVLRALRFCAHFRFQLDELTLCEMIKCSLNVRKIAKERILLELVKVKNFYNFTKLISKLNLLHIFFIQTELFVTLLSGIPACAGMTKSLPRDIRSTLMTGPNLPFTNFFIHLSRFYKIHVIPKLFEEIKSWPLNNQDLKSCEFYLKSFILDDFILDNKLTIIEANFLKYIIHIKNRPSALKEILDEIDKNELPKNTIQMFLDYFQYCNGSEINLKPKDFILDNLAFIKKMIEIKFLWNEYKGK